MSALMRFLDEQATANLTLPRIEPIPPVKPAKSRRMPVPDFTQLVRVAPEGAATIRRERRKEPVDLFEAMRDAGMSSEEQLRLISDALNKA
ncbi:hypothetical protein ACQUJT_10075 [Ralstonia pseudosolanacearum]|uniref:hypothetical protein n=1 Tax=Ralstonia solanacearum species complex bacterium KE056 TaxID=3119585 RepID=UPI002FC3125D